MSDVSRGADDIEWQLNNWGRWCHEHQIRGHCRSIEYLWRSPQEWHEPGAPVIPQGPIDRLAALACNRAWRLVPQPYKRLLSDWYVLHRNPVRSCRRLGIAPAQHDDYMHRARLMLGNLLRSQAKSGTTRGTLPISATWRAPTSEFRGVGVGEPLPV